MDLFLTLLFHRQATDEALRPLRQRLERHLRETGSEAQVVALLLASPQFQGM